MSRQTIAAKEKANAAVHPCGTDLCLDETIRAKSRDFAICRFNISVGWWVGWDCVCGGVCGLGIDRLFRWGLSIIDSRNNGWSWNTNMEQVVLLCEQVPECTYQVILSCRHWHHSIEQGFCLFSIDHEVVSGIVGHHAF